MVNSFSVATHVFGNKPRPLLLSAHSCEDTVLAFYGTKMAYLAKTESGPFESVCPYLKMVSVAKCQICIKENWLLILWCFLFSNNNETNNNR